jgi:cobalt-zinc-cadmium resistance protein CzcA
LIAALVIPITMLLTSFGMLRGGVSANLMSLERSTSASSSMAR